MRIAVWVLGGALASYGLAMNYAFASEANNSQAQTGPRMASVSPEGGDNGLSPPQPLPRPRPAAARAESAQAEQCRWLGKRIVSLLSRDDAMTAKDFNPFYERFGCPTEYLAAAFGCVVAGENQTESQELASRVDRCWADPVAGSQPKSLSGIEAPVEGQLERPADGT